MSSFRNEMEIVLDGEPYKARSRAIDFTNAEIQVSKEGGPGVMEQPMALRFRVAFLAFRRSYPDHDLARSYGRFMDALDDITDEAERDAADGVDALDPIQPVDSDG
jgi:hypothetical protein